MKHIKGKKSQAAMEFLMTYGWAILVVLVVIGALAYFGILNPQNLVPDRCTVEVGLNCKDYVISAAANLAQFRIENAGGRGIIIQKIRVNNSDAGTSGFICFENNSINAPWSGRVDGTHINSGDSALFTTGGPASIGCSSWGPAGIAAPGTGQNLLNDAAGTKRKFRSSLIISWTYDDTNLTHTSYGELFTKISP